jgi:hypothetical protein
VKIMVGLYLYELWNHLKIITQGEFPTVAGCLPFDGLDFLYYT